MQNAFAAAILFALLLLGWLEPGVKSDTWCPAGSWGCASEQTGEQADGRASVDPWGVAESNL